jgi:hypothetical protein
MLLAHINGPDCGAQIYGENIFPDPPPPPPDRSTFNGGGGGGPELLIRPARIWMAQDRARRSTVKIGFRTPPSILPLMEGGGGGSRMSDKKRAKICGHETSTQINGSKCFSDPPPMTDLPLTEGGGGGSGMVSFLWRAPLYTWQQSNGPASHRPLLSDLPSSPLDVTTHLSLK